MYSNAKMESCLKYIDSELGRAQSRVWPGHDVLALWSKATPESLAKLEELGAIKSAKTLADSFDYCARYFDEWQKEQPAPWDAFDDEYEYNGRYSDIFEKKAGSPTERMERAKNVSKAKDIFESLSDTDRHAIWADEADLSDFEIRASGKVRAIVHEMIQDWVEDPGQHK
jgi:hypothetical protein